MIDRPFAPAAERNAPYILTALRSLLASARTVLEIGSGTGQHAVCFASALPDLRWQPSDRAAQLPAIEAWRQAANLPNLMPPRALEIGRDPWPDERFDGVYTANTLHYMPWSAVVALFEALRGRLPRGGLLVVYGPFRVGGAWQGPNDAAFDAQLRASGCDRGVRDLEAVEALAVAAGLLRQDDVAMPANNRVVAWQQP